MKIVHICVCGEFYEKYAYQDNLLPKYHRKLNHDVTIVAATYSRFDKQSGKVIQDFTKTRFLEDGTKIIRLKPSLPIIINSHVHLFRGLRRTVEAEHSDFIFVHGIESPNYLFLNKYKKQHPGVKIVYDSHTDFSNSCHTKVTYFWARYIVRNFIVRPLLWTSDKFYGTTSGRCTFLSKIYGVPASKVDYLPMGADDEKMLYDKREELRESVRKQFNIQDEDFLLVTGGKIDIWKKTENLVEAVSMLNNPNIKLIVFGSIIDELADKINSVKSDNVTLIGWIPADEVYKYFYAADIVMFPGRHSVLWEQAVASRVPLAILNDVDFNHVNFKDNCYLLDDNKPQYLAEFIDSVYKNKQGYLEKCKNAEADGSQLFLYSKVAQKVLEDINQ